MLFLPPAHWSVPLLLIYLSKTFLHVITSIQYNLNNYYIHSNVCNTCNIWLIMHKNIPNSQTNKWESTPANIHSLHQYRWCICVQLRKDFGSEDKTSSFLLLTVALLVNLGKILQVSGDKSWLIFPWKIIKLRHFYFILFFLGERNCILAKYLILFEQLF